eukprot:scaffold117680_cov54-Phaeocystis_antarctica.AAC.1
MRTVRASPSTATGYCVYCLCQDPEGWTAPLIVNRSEVLLCSHGVLARRPHTARSYGFTRRTQNSTLNASPS